MNARFQIASLAAVAFALAVGMALGYCWGRGIDPRVWP